MVNKRITPTATDFGVIRGNKIGTCDGCGRTATIPATGYPKLCVSCRRARRCIYTHPMYADGRCPHRAKRAWTTCARHGTAGKHIPPKPRKAS